MKSRKNTNSNKVNGLLTAVEDARERNLFNARWLSAVSVYKEIQSYENYGFFSGYDRESAAKLRQNIEKYDQKELKKMAAMNQNELAESIDKKYETETDHLKFGLFKDEAKAVPAAKPKDAKLPVGKPAPILKTELGVMDKISQWWDPKAFNQKQRNEIIARQEQRKEKQALRKLSS